ncbi:MAG TPA: hypothetical protein VGQ10_17815, partial [Vicinamibacterales bacterium]|nr:hypothetical protein [Vicinamibacterales bacterium]
MQLHDEIASRLQPPGETCGGGMRRLPGRPIEQLTFGAGVRHHPAGVPGLGIEGIQTSRATAPIDSDIGVVDNAGIPRPELQCPYKTRRGQRYLQHERPEDIRAACRQLIRGRHRDDEVWNAKLPLVGSHQQGRATRSIPLECALRDPLDDRSDLGVGEAAFSEELSLSKFRFPRRHASLCRHDGNAFGSRLHVVVRQQAEGSDLA